MSDCPKTFKDADKWADAANAGSGDFGPKWKWDCNYKLDYDGEILHFNSRFYPPHKNDHDGWEGFLAVYILDDKIDEVELIAPTLEELKAAVEGRAGEYIDAVRLKITGGRL